MKKNNDNFEKNLTALDQLVQHLENGDLNLSDALKAFEDGIKLYKTCNETLQDVENKVKILIEDLELGEMTEVEFDLNGE